MEMEMEDGDVGVGGVVDAQRNVTLRESGGEGGATCFGLQGKERVG